MQAWGGGSLKRRKGRRTKEQEVGQGNNNPPPLHNPCSKAAPPKGSTASSSRATTGGQCSACVSLWGTLSFTLPHKCYICFLRFCSSRILMTFSLLLLGILVVLYGSCSDGLHRLTSLCSSVPISQLYGFYNPNAQETELC